MSNIRRSQLEWISIDKILPSYLNPRRELGVEVEDLKRILLSKGWQAPITVYPRGNYYIIKSGHRRWNAAKDLGMKEVPCFVTEAPKSQQEEAEEMASHQYAHVDWTVYEWAKFIYEMWVNWGKPSYVELGQLVNRSAELVKQYVTVFESFEKDEIEEKLEKHTFAISNLYKLSQWINKLKKNFPALVDSLSESVVRKMLLRKLENKRVTFQMLTNDKFIDQATEEQMKKFLISPDMTLIQARSMLGINDEPGVVGNWRGQMYRLANMTRDLATLKPKDRRQAEALARHLDALILEAKRKRKELRILTLAEGNSVTQQGDQRVSCQ
jgi:ParB family chromosome partitioning protein